MKNLSITEAYFLCAIQKRGKIRGLDSAKTMCLLLSALYELSKAAYIELEKDSVRLLDGQLPLFPYLEPVYNRLRKMDDPEYKEIMRDYNSGWSDYHLNQLTVALGNGLAERGLATKAKLGVFTNNRTYFMPAKNVLTSLLTDLRTDLLSPSGIEPGTDSILLWTLLEKSECIPEGLAPLEQDQMHQTVSHLLQKDPDSSPAVMNALAERLLSLAMTHTYEAAQYLKKKMKE